MSQNIRITAQDMESVFSELAAHKDKPVNHPNCEFCDWVQDFIKSDDGQKLAEDSRSAKEYMDRLFFLYCGVRIGRNQGVNDLLHDLEDTDPTDHSVEWEKQIDERKDPDDAA